MKSLSIALLALCASLVFGQDARTYGFVTDKGKLTGVDCGSVDNVQGCNLFNELYDADDDVVLAVLVYRTSLVCFVTDDPKQAAMFFVFSLNPRSTPPSTFEIYKNGVLARTSEFRFSADVLGAFVLHPEDKTKNGRGTLDEGQFSFHLGPGDLWYFEINMKTGRFVHGVDGKVSTGRCARHDRPEADALQE